jgi:RHS repeat-associated protein
VTSVSGVGVYGYDQVGAMVSRAGGTLVYDAMHRLVSYAGEGYVQSTSNQRLVVTGPAGRVLYLGEVEVTANGPARTVTRHVTIAGTVVAVTTTGSSTGMVWSCAHPQNSVTCHAPTGGATPGVRRYHPYGTARNSVTTPATNRGYLGQPADTTGLAYLDNRYYDPDLGVFLSVDPLVATTGTPYLYANANPTTLSDPTGLCAVTQGMHSYDDGTGFCGGGGSHGSAAGWGTGRCGGGYVERSCLPKMLPQQYQRLIGQGDGQPDRKVVYHSRPVEPGEKDLCRSSPVSCLFDADTLKEIKNIAETSRVNTDVGDGTLGNGRRHVLLAALLTWQFGEGRAREVLEAHENIRGGKLVAGQEFNDFRMTDLINNESGIELGIQFRDQFGAAAPAFVTSAMGNPAIREASGFYTGDGLLALENAVLTDPQIVYFLKSAG